MFCSSWIVSFISNLILFTFLSFHGDRLQLTSFHHPPLAGTTTPCVIWSNVSELMPSVTCNINFAFLSTDAARQASFFGFA